MLRPRDKILQYKPTHQIGQLRLAWRFVSAFPPHPRNMRRPRRTFSRRLAPLWKPYAHPSLQGSDNALFGIYSTASMSYSAWPNPQQCPSQQSASPLFVRSAGISFPHSPHRMCGNCRTSGSSLRSFADSLTMLTLLVGVSTIPRLRNFFRCAKRATVFSPHGRVAF